MYYIVPTAKSVDDAARDLEEAVRKHQFGVLHVLDLQETLTKKGYPFGRRCKIFEVCNPLQATRVLQRDMRLNMALPCRVSVFEDHSGTKIGTILPGELLRSLSHDRGLAAIAQEVEATIKAIIDDAAISADARSALLRRREVLTGEVRASAQKRSAERGDNVPDSAELADESVTRDVAVAEIDRDTAEIEAIDAALARIDAGTYGRCTACGAEIAAARLAHSPQVARCLPCQQDRERELQPHIARL